MRSFLVALIITANASSGFAAACCGGNQVFPGLLTDGFKSRLGFETSLGPVIGDAPSEGIPVFRAAGDREYLRMYSLQGAYKFENTFQLGGSVSLQERQRTKSDALSSDSGFGDATISAGYELLSGKLPSISKGIVFAQMTIPFGKSIYESTLPWTVDSHGRGFWTLGAGAALLKTWTKWDASFLTEIHHGLKKSFENAQAGDMTVNPGWGGILGLAAGYAPRASRFRIGASAQFHADEAPQIADSLGMRVGSAASYWDTGLQVSYYPKLEWLFTLNYVDQTLLGPARNTSLSRSAVFGIQRRWL